MRILANENLHSEIVRGLQKANYNVVKSILEVLNREAEILSKEKSFVIVLSESGYRIHRPGELIK
jgi:hypothetical protein